ncbi:hypothetical protein [Saccharothrix xinjiangensis]|uniref:AAA+ ATPase domain-containing protein n=1 Tax=Saccharothrix xinjiangensis TaxID=204798 RepID=A0ABV9XS38_9PSEU
MEVHARRVGVDGPHGPLLEPTSLLVRPGELIVVAGDPGRGHTALALVLSGRMRPTTGRVSPEAAELRRRVVPVDSPGVSEPEGALPLGAAVGEELALNHVRGGRGAVADWLAARDADRYLGTRVERVPAQVRCSLALELAAGRPGAEVLVLDSPDRYHPDPPGWLDLARAHVTEDRSVVVLCTTASAALLDAPAARIGADNTPEEDR